MLLPSNTKNKERRGQGTQGWPIRDPDPGLLHSRGGDCLSHRIGSSYHEAMLSCLSGEMDDYIGRHNFVNKSQNRVLEKVDNRLT